MGDCMENLIILFLCLYFPPLAIWWKTKQADSSVMIALVCCLCGCGLCASISAISKCFCDKSE